MFFGYVIVVLYFLALLLLLYFFLDPYTLEVDEINKWSREFGLKQEEIKIHAWENHHKAKATGSRSIRKILSSKNVSPD